MASKKAQKSYPPGQKPSSMPAKPTMAEAFNAAQGPAVNRPRTNNNTPVKPNLFGSAEESRAATAAPFKAVVKFFKEGGVSGKETPKVKPIPPKETADVIAQKKAADVKANTARMTKDLATGAKVVKKAAASSSSSSSSSSTGAKAKPYVKLKQPAREAARRSYVDAQLKRLGITPAKAGKPRSAKEKAARAKARATWDKKNPFVPKPKAEGNMSPSDAARERRPEA